MTKKRLVMTELTKFMPMKQELIEPVNKYLHQVRETSWYCDFEKLANEEQTVANELIQMRIIKGLHNEKHCYKMLE